MNNLLHYAPAALCILSVIGIALAMGANISDNARARVIGVLVVIVLSILLFVR